MTTRRTRHEGLGLLVVRSLWREVVLLAWQLPGLPERAVSSPTARTLELCRKLGLVACVVEKWIPQTRRRLDAFGFGDLLVLDGRPGAALLQVTDATSVSRRVHKIREECREQATAWLRAGNRIVVVGWAKRGATGKRKVWTPRFVELVLEQGGIWGEERAELARGE